MISSTINTVIYICFLSTFSLCFYSHLSSAKDYITTGERISDGAADTYLESESKIFQMGFFLRTQRGSERRYLGIWYAVDPNTVVWVANRDHPVPDSTGFLTIAEDGDVKLLDEDRNPYFNTGTGGTSNKTLKLLNNGNAVLIDNGSFTWQSFHNPTDTFLQGMEMDSKLKLSSWKSPDDPSPGSFVFLKENSMQYVIMSGTEHHWQSGSGSKNGLELNQMFPNAYSRFLMHHKGYIQYLKWTDKNWHLVWQEPKDNCSNYQACGPFGLCSSALNQTRCSCLSGFEAIEHGVNSAGCRHKGEICIKGVIDEFHKVSMIEVSNPTSSESTIESRCKRKCLENCRCVAYSYTNGDIGMQRRRPNLPNRCRIWESDLFNLQMDGTDTIYIRVSNGTGGYNNSAQGSAASPPNPSQAFSTSSNGSSSFLTKTRILVFAMTILVILFICSLSYIYYKRLVHHEQGRNSTFQTDNITERRSIDLIDLDHSREDSIQGIRVPFFEFESILAATNNFSDANKLGEGGFGPVYKGMLPEGVEVAVKRLSSLSGQGLEEFRNEVILIAKLQHRNLVRLLGYCMKGNEKMLIYEYMPNKSLDAFIFDQAPITLLNWARRYEIIIGIARGLLYLHQDSRLRIIHRDLKTSNILLDGELNPKISDFGLAKIVKDREMEASTNRVVGTYGYMAPEYALDGLFSTKSDVFSFGVVVLEIISGKKNTGFSKSRQPINLLGYAWSLWKEDRPFEMMDQKLVESSNSSEVLKCIIVGLLCVQEDPGDRPTMTNVVLMLAGDISSLPTPKQPAFVARRTMSSSSSSSYKPDQTQTNNSLTVTLQEGESIYDGAADHSYLESAGKRFRMGFFPRTQRASGQVRYLGIWYTMDPNTVVWVANRGRPVLDSSGALTVTEDGEVKVLDKNQKSYYSTKAGGVSNMTLKLLDSGNAVLVDTASGTTRWQSFLEPTDTFLPGMKMDSNLKLISWKTLDDPSIGNFEFHLEEQQYVIMNGTTPYWKSGSGSKNNFEANPLFSEAYKLLSNFSTRAMNISLCNSQNEKVTKYCKEMLDRSFKSYSRLLMNYTGKIQYLSWSERKDICSVYHVCGPFGLCSPSNQTTCSCLQGFEHGSAGVNSAGCRHEPEICGNHDVFHSVTMIKVENPNSQSFESNSDSDCKNKCLETCLCKAYSYSLGYAGTIRGGRSGQKNRCWIWEDLYNLQTNGTNNISIRVSAGTKGYLNSPKGSLPPLGNSSSFLTKKLITVFATVIPLILLLCSLSYIYYKRLVHHEQGRNSTLQANNSERRSIDLIDLFRSREDNIEGITVPFFDFEGILAATDNFSDANKLGEGGFGPVYKAKFPEGIEVAVKRLSSLSGQGLEEFRNEVILIAKLQHRNLVRLLGYCMKGNEKILLYEYMPNKSLDAFIFDQAPSILLNWEKRYEIIIGIARGLLYLHQDSRLRVIHRDLKTSNILLDEELNPKISDFGLAKIVKDREMEASTNRVIGTYGYMAPEYALDGLFSIKSDVFSFGVVVLEIISGKRNTGFSTSQHAINLLGYAWSLWTEDRPFELMDQKLVESSNSREVLKCIIVGLLCVQEDPGDRPTMTNVVLMLAGDISSLPTPKQPAFVARKTMSSSSSSSYKPDQTQTNNNLTITLEEGR